MTKLIKFITERPALNIRALETAAGMPGNTLANAVNGSRPLPEKWIAPLCRALERYGLEIEGWQITVQEDAAVFFGMKPLENVEVEGIETDIGVFTYPIPHYKNLWDLAEFIHFIKAPEPVKLENHYPVWVKWQTESQLGTMTSSKLIKSDAEAQKLETKLRQIVHTGPTLKTHENSFIGGMVDESLIPFMPKR